MSATSVYMGAPVEVGVGPGGEIANKAYSEHGKQFERKVHDVLPGIWCHVGACLGNSTMIEGKTGVIVVDTGDCIEQSAWQKEDFQKVCDKPLSALIYTHTHYAYGSKTWMPNGQDGKTPIWSHPDLLDVSLRMIGDLTPAIVHRGAIQFAMHLPADGPDSLSNMGMGPFFHRLDLYKPTTGFVRPTHYAQDGQEEVIDGVRFQFFHCISDTPDSLLIWLPETKTAINNIAWNALFNTCTLRGEPFRDPQDVLPSLDKLIELEPEHLVGVHGLPIHGKEKIKKLVTEYRDSIQYQYDQTVRGINAGLSPDDLAHSIKLPEVLAKSPLTGQFYGELPYNVRQIYSGLIGWFDNDTANLHAVHSDEEARRMVAMIGAESLVGQTREALDKHEYAWAAKLATWLLKGGEDTPENRQLKADALRAMGQVTTSCHTRSWFLTQARELEGKLATKVPPIRLVNAALVQQMPPVTYVRGLRFALSPELSAKGAKTVQLRFKSPDVAFHLQLRNGIVQIHKGRDEAATTTLTMDFANWAKVVGGDAMGAALVDAGAIQVEGDRELALTVLAAARIKQA